MAISKQFVLAGSAIFTITDPDGKHRTYKVEKVEGDGRWPTAWFVKTLTGPDNTSDYTYMGKLDPHTGQVRTTAKSASWSNTMRLKLLNRVLSRVWTGDHTAYQQHGYKCQHEGKCGRCGRLLTVPSSVDNGIGPDCAKLMGLVATKPSRVKPVTPVNKPHQTVLEASELDHRNPDEVDLSALDPHYDNDGDVTHWTGVWNGQLVMVVND